MPHNRLKPLLLLASSVGHFFFTTCPTYAPNRLKPLLLLASSVGRLTSKMGHMFLRSAPFLIIGNHFTPCHYSQAHHWTAKRTTGQLNTLNALHAHHWTARRYRLNAGQLNTLNALHAHHNHHRATTQRPTRTTTP